MISGALKDAGVSAILSDGGAVSIYSENEYQSLDLDFVTAAGFPELTPVMTGLGFTRKGRHFEHPNCEWLIEFSAGPLMFGDEIATGWADKRTRVGVIRMVTPTRCVMDRLAAFYHWNGRQCLDQAVMVARRQMVDQASIKRWSKREVHAERIAEFAATVKKKRV